MEDDSVQFVLRRFKSDLERLEFLFDLYRQYIDSAHTTCRTRDAPRKASKKIVKRFPYCYNSTAMATITILPEKNNSYRAVAGDKESTGRTAGEALDALTSQLEDEESGAFIVIPKPKADHFFDAAQQQRLTELMQLRSRGNLSTEEEKELESLVEAELNGARQRAESLLNELKP